MTLRVLQYWANGGEDRAFTIVDYNSTLYGTVHPLTHFPHKPVWEVSVTAFNSVQQLKKQLRDMLKACDEPHLVLHPERVTQASAKEAA